MPAHTPQARTSLGATLYLTSHPSTQVQIDGRAPRGAWRHLQVPGSRASLSWRVVRLLRQWLCSSEHGGRLGCLWERDCAFVRWRSCAPLQPHSHAGADGVCTLVASLYRAAHTVVSCTHLQPRGPAPLPGSWATVESRFNPGRGTTRTGEPTPASNSCAVGCDVRYLC